MSILDSIKNSVVSWFQNNLGNVGTGLKTVGSGLSDVYKPDLKKSLKKVDYAFENVAPYSLAKDIFVEFPSRTIQSTVQSFTGQQVLSPTIWLQKKLYGTEPVKDILTRQTDIESVIKKYVPQIGGATPAIAPLAVALGSVLDLTGFGGGEKTLVKTLTKLTKVDEVADVLRKVNVSEDLIPEYSKMIAGFKKEEQVSKALTSIEKIQSATSNPLIQEARKYKSAEEFVKGQIPMTQFTEKGKAGEFWTTPEGAISDYGNIRKDAFIDTNNPKVFKGSSSLEYIKENGLLTPEIQKKIDNAWNTSNPMMEYKIPQDIAKVDLQNKGYSAAHWLSEDELNPTQYQIWDKSIIKTKSQLTDIWEKANKEIPTTPKLKTEITNTIAQDAIKYAKENPDSFLVGKEFRDPTTKELIGGEKLFKRIGEGLRNGEISIESLPELSQKYGLTGDATAKLFEETASYAGKTLGALGKVEKELRKLIPDIKLPERPLTSWERIKSLYLAVDNFRRGLLVTQLATAARNVISQGARYSLGTITDAMNGVIGKMTGKKDAFTPFFEDIAAIIRKTNPENLKELQKILKNYPIENARLYNTPVGDVALSGKVLNTLNAFNRGQEYFFRNLILDAKLNASAKRLGTGIEKLPLDEFRKAVDEALDWTFAKSPVKGSFGNAILQTYKAMPPLTLINPFPRFMANSVKFLYDYSPMGIMSLFRKETRAAIAAGDYTAISKAVIGTSMLGGAMAIRANQSLAGEKWYEIKVGDKVIDTRPFAPFSTYMLLAEMMVNGGKTMTTKDWALAAVGINRVAGTGLALIDLFQGNLDADNVKDIVNNVVSSYIGGFTVPFVTIKDIIGNFKLEERTIKETRELPIIGAAVGNIPGLNELLPTNYSLFQDKPLEREQGLLRQFTGITITTKSYIQKELDRMGKQVGDLVPKTGVLEANRIITKQTGVILDKFNDKIKLSQNYSKLPDDQKLELIKTLVSEAKKEAKGDMASELAGVVYNELKNSKPDKRKKTMESLNNRGLLTENILEYLLPMLESQPLSK